MPNIKKFDYEYECSTRGLKLVDEDSNWVYVLDSFGFNHKTLKGSLRRGCSIGFKSVLCEDKKDYFIAVHKDKFPSDHNKTCFEDFEYQGALTYTYVRCVIHDFTYKTRPNSLLNRGSHCKHCGLESGNKTKYLTQDDYLRKSKEVHGERYTYEKTSYKSAREYVTITCKKHGDFQCLAYIHLQGCGCQICGVEKGGFSRSDYRDVCPNGSNVYIIRMQLEQDVFLKVGISKDVDYRISRLKGEGLTNVELLHKEYFKNSSDAWDVEKILHKEFYEYSYTPKIKFGGSTECFDLSIKDEVIKVLQCIS